MPAMRLSLRLNGNAVRAFHVALAERLSLLPGVELCIDARPAAGGVPRAAEALFQLETLIHRLPANGTAKACANFDARRPCEGVRAGRSHHRPRRRCRARRKGLAARL
ncbi:hypothetical protein ACVOMV_32745 [Mesorhizobium atlanticum]